MFSTIKQLINNYLGSEKAVAALTVLIGATIFTLTGKMSISEWKEMALYVLGIYTAGKTIQGAAAMFKPAATPSPTTTPAPEALIEVPIDVTTDVAVSAAKSKAKKK